MRGRLVMGALAALAVTAGLTACGAATPSARPEVHDAAAVLSPAASATPPATTASTTPEPSATVTAAPSKTKACPPVSAPSPMAGVKLAMRPHQVGRTLKADVDGDGRGDTVRLLAGWRNAWGGYVDELIATFARGGSATAQVPDYSPDAPGSITRLLGTADVNADGRGEIVVYGGGETESFGYLVTLVGKRLMIATTCMYDPTDGWRRDTPVGFAAHSNSCGPWCQSTTACRDVNGQPRLVVIDGSADPPGVVPVRRKVWTVDVYRLAGADLVKTATYKGSVRGDGPLPSRWPFLNALDCGTAHYPADG